MPDPKRDRVFHGVLIGRGFFARNHMYSWAELDGAEIVAVCDRDPAKAEAFATDFGVAARYSDAEAMLAREDIDFVDIATTVQSHRPLVELAAYEAAERHTVIDMKTWREV